VRRVGAASPRRFRLGWTTRRVLEGLPATANIRGWVGRRFGVAEAGCVGCVGCLHNGGGRLRRPGPRGTPARHGERGGGRLRSVGGINAGLVPLSRPAEGWMGRVMAQPRRNLPEPSELFRVSHVVGDCVSSWDGTRKGITRPLPPGRDGVPVGTDAGAMVVLARRTLSDEATSWRLATHGFCRLLWARDQRQLAAQLMPTGFGRRAAQRAREGSGSRVQRSLLGGYRMPGAVHGAYA
jgi:hypothetical protein